MDSSVEKIVTRFQILDLGAAPIGELVTGPSFLGFDYEVMGTGATACEAVTNALQAMATDSIDTSGVRAQAVASGYYGDEAKVDSGDLVKADEEEAEAEADPEYLLEPEYVVVIRFDLASA